MTKPVFFVECNDAYNPKLELQTEFSKLELNEEVFNFEGSAIECAAEFRRLAKCWKSRLELPCRALDANKVWAGTQINPGQMYALLNQPFEDQSRYPIAWFYVRAGESIYLFERVSEGAFVKTLKGPRRVPYTFFKKDGQAFKHLANKLFQA